MEVERSGFLGDLLLFFGDFSFVGVSRGGRSAMALARGIFKGDIAIEIGEAIIPQDGVQGSDICT